MGGKVVVSETELGDTSVGSVYDVASARDERTRKRAERIALKTKNVPRRSRDYESVRVRV